MQLLRLVNGLLDKHPESRSRKLAAHAPIIVPVYSQVHCCAAETHACRLVCGSLCGELWVDDVHMMALWQQRHAALSN